MLINIFTLDYKKKWKNQLVTTKLTHIDQDHFYLHQLRG